MPPNGHPDLDDRTLDLLSKQLDRYGVIVGRLGGNSVQAKTWCLTAIAALAAVAINNDKPSLLWLGFPVLITFLILDAYYLALERAFRQRSHAVATSGEAQLSWSDLVLVDKPAGSTGVRRVAASVWSGGIWPFYVGVSTVLLVGLLVSR